MNIIQLQDNLKNLSDQQLTQAIQMPSQDTPPYLVVSELNRRKKMRDSFQAQQADQDKTTVAQDVVAAAGVPQEAASQMAQSLAPQTDMTNNTSIMSIPQGAPMQSMASGGVIKLQTGTDEQRRAELKRRQLSFGNAVDDTIGAAKNAADWYFLGLPQAGIERVASGLGDAAAYGIGLIPGMEDVSMGISDLAAQSADNAQTFYDEGMFPDYYRYEPTMPSDPRVDGAPVADPKAQAAITAAKTAIAAKEAAKEVAASSSSSGGGGGGGGPSTPSTYEQALIEALANVEKRATQDKWMALAQMGLSLMSSQQPNFLAALGEAGTAAIPAFQSARDAAEVDKLKLQGGLYDIDMKRQARNDALASAAARANAPGKPKAIDVGALTALDSQIKSLTEQLAILPDGDAKLQAADQLGVLQQQAQYILAAYLQQRGATGGIAGVPINTEDPADSADLSTPQP